MKTIERPRCPGKPRPIFQPITHLEVFRILRAQGMARHPAWQLATMRCALGYYWSIGDFTPHRSGRIINMDPVA